VETPFLPGPIIERPKYDGICRSRIELASDQRARLPYLVVIAAALLNIVSYIDRSSISVAAPSIRKELQLTPTQLGVVFSSFFLSYALLQIPWGVAADRFGPRKIVTFAILAWSTFTALTGAAASYRALVFIRFTFGGMEAALSPAIGSSLARWIPERRRATAFGIFLAGGRLGGAFAPALSALLLLHFGWRATFLLIATAGPLAALVWVRAAPSRSGMETVPKPLELDEKLPRSLRMLALLLVNFGYTFMWQFYATWFPTYLIERRGYSLAQAAGYAALPFLLGIGSNWAGGLFSDLLSRKLGKPLGRGAVGLLSLSIAGLLFYFGIVGSTRASVWLLAAAAGFGDLFLPIAWSVATELGGKSAGAFAALMNSASSLGGFVSPIVLGAAIQRSGNWNFALMANVGAVLGAALLWPIVIWPINSKAIALRG
jgi:MFS transporter, ACS family, glucarate transporter